jgi:G3E family GTPase
MPVPVLLIAGFLGAGKTTLVNRLLAEAGGRRIAAIVNDFGAINIDAELIAGAKDGVVDLANGCICCSLEGDLLRTLATLLRRTPRPEAIVIETSGVADPADIVRNLMDPVVWREAPLETVLCVVDATTIAANAADPLVQAQLRAADLVALSKTDLTDEAGCAAAHTAVAALNRRALVVEAPGGAVPLPLLLPEVPRAEVRDVAPKRPRLERFESFGWSSPAPISLAAFQQAIGRIAGRLARAKGFLATIEQPGRRQLFQLAGGRATLAPVAAEESGSEGTRLVFIAETGALSQAEIDAAMAGC